MTPCKLTTYFLARWPRLGCLVLGIWEGVRRAAGGKPNDCLAVGLQCRDTGKSAGILWYRWRRWRYHIWAVADLTTGKTLVSSEAADHYENLGFPVDRSGSA